MELCCQHAVVAGEPTHRKVIGEWVPIAPPLIITEAEVRELVERLEAALASLEGEAREGGALPRQRARRVVEAPE